MILRKNIPSRKIDCVATIGAFDGIHRGHRYLLNKVLRESRKAKLASVLITFWPLPSLVLGKNHYGFLTDLDQKIDIIKELGFDHFLILKTNDRLLKTDGEHFFTKISQQLNIKKLIVGEDFRFGRKAAYTAGDLKKIAAAYGCRVTIIKKRKYRGELISSSAIRRAISAGDVKKVKAYLMRCYRPAGVRIKGRGIGAQIGYPTVNFDLGGFVIPAKGVYAVRVYSGDHSFLGAGSVGYAPTVAKTKKVQVEAHLLDYHGSRLKERLDIEFLQWIRLQKRFSSLNALKKAISRDIHRWILPKYSS